MSDPIRQLCTILLEKAQSRAGEDLSSIVSDVLAELDCNAELSQSLRQDARMLQINMGQSKGYQVLVEAQATAYIGDQYHVNTEAVIKALGQLLDEFAKKQPIVGTPNNLPLSGAIAFIGRESKLTELDQQLQGKDRIAITAVQGMGGIGKTELALQYAITSLPKKSYPGGICWLRSRDQEIATQIISFAKVNLGLNIPDDMQATEQVKFIWQRWPEGNSLIVIDDVTDYNAITPYLPPSDLRFKVLITTRQNFGASFTCMNIEELSDEDAITLLKSIVGNERIESQRSDAELLCKWVGNLPLGLELLGRFLAGKEDWAITKLLKQLESKRLEAKALIETKTGMTASLGVAAALELSWAELSEQEQDLAYLLGMFAVAPIPWNLVEQCFEEVDPDDIEDWRDEGLRDHSLIKRVGEGSYQLHQIVQEYFRIKLEQRLDQGQGIKSGFCGVMVAIAKTIDDIPTIDVIEGVRSAIIHLEEVASRWIDSVNDEDLLPLFVGIARLYEHKGDYKYAEFFYSKCLEIVQIRLGKHHLDVASSQNNLASNYRLQGQHDKAEELYLNALNLYKNLRLEHSQKFAAALNNLAALYELQGSYEKAEKFHVRALELSKSLLGNHHLEVALSLNNLGLLYLYQGRYFESEKLIIEALNLFKNLLGNRHINVATSLSNLGLLYYHQKRFKESERYHIEALEMSQSLLGDQHHYIGTSLDNIALLYESQKRYEESEKLYLDALTLRKRLFGEHHPDVATSMNNLAELYRIQDRYEEAETLYIKSLDICKSLYGNFHPNTATSFNNLALLYYSQKKYREAEQLFIRSLDLKKLVLGESHLDFIATQLNLGQLYQQQGRNEEAKALYQKALAITESKLESSHPHTQVIKSLLASLPQSP